MLDAAKLPVRLRTACAALVAACGLACAAGDDTRDAAVSIDLTEPLRCTVLGKDAPPPSPPSAWRQDEVEPIDAYLRLPAADSRLEFRVAGADAADAFRITVASDDASATLSPVFEEGLWRADLSAFDGKVVRLRFEGLAAEPLVWTAPTVVGLDPPADAPLDPLPPAGRGSDARYNIVLYVVDTLRADRMSLYGHARETSPNVERLARGGRVFESAYANGPSTLATMPAMFSSQHASMLRAQLRPEGGVAWTLPELLQDAGYRTGGFQANPWVSVANGFGRGFDEYAIVTGRSSKLGWKSPTAEKLHRRALAWLDATPDPRDREPFFLFVQPMDVHAPYEPPAPFRERFPLLEEPAGPRAERPIRMEIAKLMAGPLVKDLAGDESRNAGRYEGSIAYADAQLAALVEQLRARGLADRTIVFLTADHGEALGNFDDGTYLHGHSLYEELVRVPLVVFVPGQGEDDAPNGERLARPVSVLDLAPTLLDIAGVTPPTETTGRSLFSPDRPSCPRAVQGELTDTPHHAGPVAQGPRPVDEWFVREGRWKLLGGPEGRGLFDLVADPREEHDLRAERPILTAWLEEIRRTSVAHGRAARDFGAELPRDSADQRAVEDALRRLGYIE